MIARVGKNPGKGKGTQVDRHVLAALSEGEGFTLEATLGAKTISLDMSRDDLAQLRDRIDALLVPSPALARAVAERDEQAERANVNAMHGNRMMAERDNADAAARRLYRERDEVLDLLRPLVVRGQQLLTRRLGPPEASLPSIHDAIDVAQAFEAGDPDRHYGEPPPPAEALVMAGRFIVELKQAADAFLEALGNPLRPGATDMFQRLPRVLGTDLDTQHEQTFCLTFHRIVEGQVMLSWGGAEPPECAGGGEGCSNPVERGETLCRWCREEPTRKAAEAA